VVHAQAVFRRGAWLRYLTKASVACTSPSYVPYLWSAQWQLFSYQPAFSSSDRAWAVIALIDGKRLVFTLGQPDEL
jgi:hypothetical protein